MSNVTYLTTKIAAAYVTGNKMPSNQVAGLVATLKDSLGRLSGEAPNSVAVRVRPTEAQIRASIRPNGLLSFEDGKVYKMLKRHLTKRGMTMQDYRIKWGLPLDYPSVAAEYSARRSEISNKVAAGYRRPVAAV